MQRRLAWCLALAAIAASALVHSARWSWIGELAASFSWHAGWTMLASAAAVLALGSRRLALALAALGAVHVAPELLLSFGAAATRHDLPELTLVSANLLQPNRHGDEVADALERTDADVIALLEVSKPMRETLDRRLAAWPHRVYSPEREWNATIWALAVYSKRPLEEVRLAQLRECYAPAIEVAVPCGEDRVLLRVVHLPRPGRAWRVEARNQVLDDLAREFPWDGRCVLAGDLNTASTSPAFGALLDRTGLRDSRSGFGRQPTWSLRKLLVPLSIAIDHVLVGERVEVRSRETFEIPFSDHRGVLARLASGPVTAPAR